jgi:ABC-type nitrate/sulfonate/bicarbonate transport system permease component
MVLVALKLAAPAALVGAIFGEWFGADRGLGLLLLMSMQNFVVAQLWAVAFLCTGVAIALYGLRFSLANVRTDIALAWGVALVIVALSLAAFAVAMRAERLVHRRFA